MDEITKALSGKENVLLAQGTKEEHSLCEYTHTHTKPMFVYRSVSVFSLSVLTSPVMRHLALVTLDVA